MPIPPTNTTPETAYSLNGLVPLADTINLSGLANPQKVWFKYTTVGLQFSISAMGIHEGEIDFLYRPSWKFYVDPLGTSFQNGRGSGSAIEGFYEVAPGVPLEGDFYISLENYFIGPSFVPTVATEVYFKVIPNTAAPIGSLIINNDIDGFPATVLDPDGNPTQLRAMPSGESAAILENGISLWSDSTDNTKFKRYSAILEPLGEITWPRGHLRAPISSNRTSTFYIATNSIEPGKITTVSSDGTLGLTEWQVTNPSNTRTDYNHVAPSLVDNDIIYINASFNPIALDHYGISKFHKSTGVKDLPFIPDNDDDYGQGGFYGKEFLIFPSDDILIMYRNFDDLGDQIRLYNSSGTLVRTFSVPDGDVNHIAYAGSGYLTFWVWSFDYDDFDSHFREFRISDGVVLTEFTLKTTTSSQSFSSEGTGLGDMYGVPESCPFIVTTTETPPYGDGDTPEIPLDPTGIYFVSPAKPTKHDSYYGNDERKIPNPTVKTALFGE